MLFFLATSPYSSSKPRTMGRFTGRPVDQFYFLFFAMHIPITLLVDIQTLYPPSLLARTPLPALMKWYLSWSRDPVLIGAAGSSWDWAWLRVFLHSEGYFQLPIFFIAAGMLWYSESQAVEVC